MKVFLLVILMFSLNVGADTSAPEGSCLQTLSAQIRAHEAVNNIKLKLREFRRSVLKIREEAEDLEAGLGAVAVTSQSIWLQLKKRRLAQRICGIEKMVDLPEEDPSQELNIDGEIRKGSEISDYLRERALASSFLSKEGRAAHRLNRWSQGLKGEVWGYFSFNRWERENQQRVAVHGTPIPARQTWFILEDYFLFIDPADQQLTLVHLRRSSLGRPSFPEQPVAAEPLRVLQPAFAEAVVPSGSPGRRRRN